MRDGDLLRDIEAVPGRVNIHGLRVLAVAAFGEEPFLVFFGDTDAAVFHCEDDLRAVSLKRDGTKIVFAVKDSGIGITEEDKKRLFTEGGHGEDSQTVNVHSTGYGLYIAKQIAIAHGGAIRAESEGADKGSTFIVEFPVAA